jgi:hypothetical protein
MKVLNHELKQYWVHFQAGHTKGNQIYPRAIIKCYDDNDFLLQLNFYSEGKRIPENYYDTNSKLVYLRYPLSMYPNILDILRNEKPIYFSYYVGSKLGF